MRRVTLRTTMVLAMAMRPAGVRCSRVGSRQSAIARASQSLRAAINDLSATFGQRYRDSDKYLAELARLEAGVTAGDPQDAGMLRQLQQKALLANPLLEDLPILVVKRKFGPRQPHRERLGRRPALLWSPGYAEQSRVQQLATARGLGQ